MFDNDRHVKRCVGSDTLRKTLSISCLIPSERSVVSRGNARLGPTLCSPFLSSSFSFPIPAREDRASPPCSFLGEPAMLLSQRSCLAPHRARYSFLGEMCPTPPLALLERRRRQPPGYLWSRGVASRRSQRERREGIEWSSMRGVCSSPDSLFHSRCDPGHRPRFLLQWHGGAFGDHALVRAGDLLDPLAIIVDNICVICCKVISKF
jgi:hypothetical protein